MAHMEDIFGSLPSSISIIEDWTIRSTKTPVGEIVGAWISNESSSYQLLEW
jgi:hypothetical protein